MKIPFSIEYRPQIESGEYKVETELGNPAIVMDWEWNNNGEKCLAVKIPGHGKDSGLLYNYNGKKAGFFPEEGGDLLIVTPEPELTEFEKALESFYNHHLQVCTYDNQGTVEDSLHDGASKLLSIARKQLQPEIDAEIEKAYKTADEVMYRKGKEDGIVEARNDITARIVALKQAKDRAEEALKDLPRWKRDDSIEAEQHITVGKNGERFHYKGHSLLISDLTKLPGFKEDEK